MEEADDVYASFPHPLRLASARHYSTTITPGSSNRQDMRLWTVESGFESLPRNFAARPHRLEAKDAALSRQKPEFESRWGHLQLQTLPTLLSPSFPRWCPYDAQHVFLYTISLTHVADCASPRLGDSLTTVARFLTACCR